MKARRGLGRRGRETVVFFIEREREKEEVEIRVLRLWLCYLSTQRFGRETADLISLFSTVIIGT